MRIDMRAWRYELLGLALLLIYCTGKLSINYLVRTTSENRAQSLSRTMPANDPLIRCTIHVRDETKRALEGARIRMRQAGTAFPEEYVHDMRTNAAYDIALWEHRALERCPLPTQESPFAFSP